ncbi:DUF423 domain-containing protein [Coralloluteibacterium thermophilus]|uniref:DUF423 domain-containing protein n=1 Tax=Coralloluteibacterium thermophilum TaxID=2707049 RepID=A0ABV9NJS5_9GAMM
MSGSHGSPALPQRALAAAGAVLCALAVGLAAYASHGVDGLAQQRLGTAALFAFGHGLALAALAPHARRPLGRLALCVVLLGVLLFAGTLAASVLLGTGTRLAPTGGSALMVGWLLWAVAASAAKE